MCGKCDTFTDPYSLYIIVLCCIEIANINSNYTDCLWFVQDSRKKRGVKPS